MNALCLVIACCAPLAALTFAADSSRFSPKTARELLPLICAAGKSKFTESAKGYACTPCPSFTGFAGDGTSQAFELTAVTFAKPFRADETLAIADFSGCEPHVTNFGGTVLLRWQGETRWQFLRYQPGIRTTDCLKFAGRDRLDRVLCRINYGNMGIFAESVGVLNPQGAGDVQELMRTVSNDGQCMNPKLRTFDWLEYRQTDLNNDKRPDLQITVRETLRVMAPDWNCDDNAVPRSRTVKTYRLEFFFDGATFRPSPATVSVVKYLNSIAL